LGKVRTPRLVSSSLSSSNAKTTVKSVQNFVKLSEDESVKTLADNQEKLNLSLSNQMKLCYTIKCH